MVLDAPDYETEEFVYRVSNMAFERNGRIVFDASVNSIKSI